MGTDKALVQLGGRPLVVHAVRILREAGLAVSIAGGPAHLNEFAPVIEDSEPGLGPLGGICAALDASRAQLGIFQPVDLPLLPSQLIEYLLHSARITGRAVTLCSVSGFTQTFPAAIGQEALPALVRELSAGRGGCFRAFQAAAARLGQPVGVLPVELLVQSGQVADSRGWPPFRWFLNVNSPQELRRADLHLGHAGRVE
jgi:molybdopterin-guanine dinucleotide biosynthesis protein A